MLRRLRQLFAGAGGSGGARSPFAFWRRAPRPVPAHLLWDGEPVQLPSDGVGPLFHRRYMVDIAGPQLDAAALMARVQADVGAFSPRLLADFQKRRGDPHVMRQGDEYDIKIMGPWNGAVRVTEVKPTLFTFVTLEGHPEAGQITFEVEPHPTTPGALHFEIRSWARSRDMLVSLTYKEGVVGKEIQKNAWVAFCDEVVAASGGEAMAEVEVITEEREFTREVVRVA